MKPLYYLISLLLISCGTTPVALEIPNDGHNYEYWSTQYAQEVDGNWIKETTNYDTVIHTTTYSWLMEDGSTKKQIRTANKIYKNNDSIISRALEHDTVVNLYYYEKNQYAKHAYTLKEWVYHDTMISVLLIDIRWRDSFRQWLKD